MRGEVTGEIMLVVAVLLSISILFVQVFELANFQITSSKDVMTKSIAKDVVSIIDSTGSVAGNSTIVYEPPRMYYELNVTEGFVFVKGKEGNMASVPFTFDCVMPNNIDNEREIIISKLDGCIYVGTFISCTSTEECEGEYCRGFSRNDYKCQEECAGDLQYAADENSCCPGLGFQEETNICYDASACSVLSGQCSGMTGCCPGLSCVNTTGPSSEGYCCSPGWKWNETTGNCQEPVITYTILIVPIEWQGKLDYADASEFIASYYLERLPLRSCPGQFEYLTADLNTDYGAQWTNGYCDVSSHNMGEEGCYTDYDILSTIDTCGDEYRTATGNDFDFVVGIDDDDIAAYDFADSVCKYSVGGWSDGMGGTSAVISEATNRVLAAGITTHELGHEFGLMEQYCDCTGTSEEWRCSTEETVTGPYGNTRTLLNPLRLSLGCGGVGDSSCWTGFSMPVTSSVSCPVVHGNYDEKNQDNNNDGETDRSAMSNRILLQGNAEQGYYSTEEFDVITNDPRMRCL